MSSRALASFSIALVAAALLSCGAGWAGTGSGGQTWLVASDIHLDPFNSDADPSLVGSDTNSALFDSVVAQMKRNVRNPAIVLLPGDFLAHDFARLAGKHGTASATDAGVRAMRTIASAFRAAYPNAQFAIALGNNDAPCGDYRSELGDSYLPAVARIWAPLVNRHGAAPDFARSFARTGSYAATLPMRGMRLLVLNDVPSSSEYGGNCGGDGAAAREELAWLGAALAATPPGTRNVVMMHIPPGYDAYSTQQIRGFLPWSFLNGRDNAMLLDALSSPSGRVAFAIAGHAHRFDFRLAGNVPVVVFGSISPVYHNNPGFYALHLGADGSLRDVQVYAFDEWSQEWQPPRSFDAKWKVDRIDAATLSRLHARLENDPAMRKLWDAASNNWPSNWQVAWGMWGPTWRVAWCAQTVLVQGFERCAGIERRVAFTRYVVPLLAIAILAGFAAAIVAIVRRRRRKRSLLRA